MPMFSVIFESNGETICGFHVSASDEADARAHADAFYSRYPEYDPSAQYPGLIVRVERTVMPDLPPPDQASPPAIEQPARSEPIVIAIDKDGSITFNGEPISMDEIVPRLRAAGQGEGQEK